MPITITSPVGPGIGPGLTVSASSSFIGPIPDTGFWTIDIVEPGTEEPIYGEIIHTNVLAIQTILGLYAGTTAAKSPTRGVAEGTTVNMVIALHQSPTVVLDQTTFTSRTWQPTSALQFLLAQTVGSINTGFTAEDRSDIQATLAATRVSIPAVAAVGGSILRGLGELVQGVPPQFTNRHGSILVSGQGSLARGTEPFRVDALGIEWHWNTIPPGFGRTPGSVDELGRRIVQWRLIDQDDSGQLFQRGYVDSQVDGERFVWGVHSPVTLEWFVAPGCVVELSFLVAFLG